MSKLELYTHPSTITFNHICQEATAGEQSVLEIDMLAAGKMGMLKDLSDFNKNQTVMARQLGQSISKMAGPVGCFRYAVVST